MPETETNDLYSEFITRLIAEKDMSHKAICKQADISYSHSREVVAGRSNVGEKSLYKLLCMHYSRTFALTTMRDRLGFDYPAGDVLERVKAEPMKLKISDGREALFACKLVALDELPVETAMAMLGRQYDEILAKFSELGFCEVSGNKVIASQAFVEIFDSSSLKEMARLIVSLTNVDLEFNVQNVWAFGLNREGMSLVKNLLIKFVGELLNIFHNPAYQGKEAFSIAINTTIL